ncbi:MAG TPA: hypothetical protein DCS93_01180 [Microscillaceae bacterium]|nr:hypothetical protein [Microscillaceae bacterium]
MINNSNREQLIQQYIQGELSAADVEQFEALMAKDTTLKNEVNLQREILANIEDALALQEIEGIFEEVALDQKAFIQQTAKQTYKRHQRNNGWKNLFIVLIVGGSLVAGGLFVAQRYKQRNAPLANKASGLQALKLPNMIVQNQDSPVNKTTDVLKQAPIADQARLGLGKENNQVEKNVKDMKLQAPSPITLPPLSRKLDSLPELRFNQGLGFGKTLETNTRFRLVYFYNRLPQATQPQQEAFYQFQDTLRFYGPVGKTQQLHLLFYPRKGEYALVTPKDTLPLQYRESKILSLRRKK